MLTVLTTTLIIWDISRSLCISFPGAKNNGTKKFFFKVWTSFQSFLMSWNQIHSPQIFSDHQWGSISCNANKIFQIKLMIFYTFYYIFFNIFTSSSTLQAYNFSVIFISQLTLLVNTASCDVSTIFYQNLVKNRQKILKHFSVS